MMVANVGDLWVLISTRAVLEYPLGSQVTNIPLLASDMQQPWCDCKVHGYVSTGTSQGIRIRDSTSSVGHSDGKSLGRIGAGS